MELQIGFSARRNILYFWRYELIYNILNTRYRDYLNRFRYFSDEQGRSIAIRINVPFNF